MSQRRVDVPEGRMAAGPPADAIHASATPTRDVALWLEGSDCRDLLAKNSACDVAATCVTLRFGTESIDF